MLREVKLKEDELLGAKKPGLLGLSYRVWLLVALALGLFTFSRLIFPSADIPLSHYTTSGNVLTPRDYLNASAADPAPFAFCPVFGPGDPVAERRGQWGLLKSRIHVGSGARVQRVIQKAMAGLPVTISVLGGSGQWFMIVHQSVGADPSDGASVSACHGAGEDPVSPRCYPAKFFDWWNSVFPHAQSELTNGAARKTDSAYFAYCSMHHLPDETDLVILEFDATDPNDPQWLTHFELLVRSILVRPDQPAVIIMGHFAPQIQAQNGFAGPELLHTVVAQFYDVPHISAKGLLYQDYLADPEQARSKYFTDAVLANQVGHDLIADMLISYMMTQICSGWAATMGHAFDVPYMGQTSPAAEDDQTVLSTSTEDAESDAGGVAAKMKAIKVPQARLSDRPSDILRFREVEPFCVSANDLINPLPPSLFFGSGWHAFHPSKGAAVEEKHYWFSEIAGSRLRVPIHLGSGDVGIYYLQNPEDNPLGRAACWVDDNVAGAYELSGWADVHDTTPTLTFIDQDVAKGDHYVECVLLGEAGQTTPPFKLLGIFAT